MLELSAAAGHFVCGLGGGVTFSGDDAGVRVADVGERFAVCFRAKATHGVRAKQGKVYFFARSFQNSSRRMAASPLPSFQSRATISPKARSGRPPRWPGRQFADGLLKECLVGRTVPHEFRQCVRGVEERKAVRWPELRGRPPL